MQYSSEMIFIVGTYIRRGGGILYKECSRKCRIWFPSVSVPSKPSMSEKSRRSFPAPTLVKIHVLLYILNSNPHPFHSFRGLKNQMWNRIACGLDLWSRAGFWKNDTAAVHTITTIQYNNLLFYLLFIYSLDSPSSLIIESLSVTQSLSSLSLPSSSHRMSSLDLSKALLMQHFLKDLTIMLTRMAFHAADTHCTTSEGAVHLIFPVSVNSRKGSTIQVRYCCLNLSL